MNAATLPAILDAIVKRGRALRSRTIGVPPKEIRCSANELETLCRELLSNRGEASGIRLAQDILAWYEALNPRNRASFFNLLAQRFGPDPDKLAIACQDYLRARTSSALIALTAATEPPRQELFRRLNHAPGGTHALVALREDLLTAMEPSAGVVDADLVHLFRSWFNRGFLVLERISWSSPADVLERIIRDPS